MPVSKLPFSRPAAIELEQRASSAFVTGRRNARRASVERIFVAQALFLAARRRRTAGEDALGGSACRRAQSG